MQSHKNRLENELAFVLHSYPFRETSLLVEIFSRRHGRIPLVARGARRPKSAVRGVLMNFQPLLLSWFGKHEVRTLHGAEWQGGQPLLQGTALMCGFYLNELLLNLMVRDDPHEQLFDYYQHTLMQLSRGEDPASTLRCFEKHMLQELGYALLLENEAGSNQEIDPECTYFYIVERGAVRVDEQGESCVQICGKTLLDIAADDYTDPKTAREGKQLMRMLLNHHLGGKALHTRELIKDLTKL